MALADILTRIEGDSAAETDTITSAATERAEALVRDAERRAALHRAEVASASAAAAAREADTVVVNARLAARDAEVSARRELIGETLAAAADTLAALPDEQYARYLARNIATAARGGETLRFGSADVGRASAVVSALADIAPGLALDVAEPHAPFERGALLEGDRVRADLSLASLIAERRDELEVVVARTLFDEEA